MNELTKEIIILLSGKSIKHEIHRFPSGAIMIDIWYNDYFFVLQLYDNTMGFSKITKENPGFDTIPDIVFHDAEAFKQKLNEALA